MKARVLIPLVLSLAAAVACSDDDPVAIVPVTSADTTYVDAAGGDDANNGSQRAPWATITHATAQSGKGVTIRVAPGIYSAASGETFPIFLKPGQQLVGDVANRGMGGTPTRIQGEAPFELYLLDLATVVGAEGARIAGFSLTSETDPNFLACVAVDTVAAEIDHNTFFGAYAGINASNGADLHVHDNLFQTRTYGLIMDRSGVSNVHDNTIELGSVGIRYYVIDGMVIENNTIRSADIGVQFGQDGVTIRDNLFDSPGGYTLGALRSTSGSPVIRGNTFTSGPALIVQQGGTPDFGTLASPGLNNFSAINGVVVQHEGTGVITAIGNTWPNTPPLVGTDIVITGTGSVVTQ